MLDKRINDTYELHRHIEQRNLLRKARKLRAEGKDDEAQKVEQEWYAKYGKNY